MSERRRAARLALAGAFVLWVALARADGGTLQPTGYYKNLLVRSETWTGEPFTLDLNRLRVELKGPITPALRIDLQYDNEVLLGSYLRTLQFQQQKDLPAPQYWRADANYLESTDVYGSHRLHRAALSLSAGDTDLHFGRQRVAWGTGRFWSPLDLLNPLNPTALERDERPGVDALLAEHRLGPLSKVAAVVAPDRRSGRSSAALQWHANAGGLDYSLVAGRLRGWRTLGIDLAGQVGQAGVRAELVRHWPREAPAFNRVLLGIDQAFENTLTLTAEFFFNGAGARRTAHYDFRALMTGETPALARRYVGVHAGYELTPLLKWTNELVLNLDDRSRYAGSSLAYSLRTNLDIKLGLQSFSGATGSEYSRPPDLVYLQLQRFF